MLAGISPNVGKIYVLRDLDSQIEVHLTELGATVTNLFVQDRDGSLQDVLLGCPSAEEYADPHPCFNCVVGRYANRIKDARFELEGDVYPLKANLGSHQIHGGRRGFANRIWESKEVPSGVEFSLFSPDGEEGYPGDLAVQATYTLIEDTLRLEIKASTTRTTPISMTAHHYFNLSGEQGSTIRDHVLQIEADRYCPAAPDLTQLGLIEEVKGTPFDFRTPKPIGGPRGLDSKHPQIQLADGFDHNFVLSQNDGSAVATLLDRDSGRRLEVRTNQPCMQLYTSNTLTAAGKDQVHYAKHQGICLETQQFPDSLNCENYPDSVLRPNEHFQAVTEYQFTTF